MYKKLKIHNLFDKVNLFDKKSAEIKIFDVTLKIHF